MTYSVTEGREKTRSLKERKKKKKERGRRSGN
jgi:hypothetical protein